MHVVPRPEPPPSRAADADSSGIWQRLIGGDKRQFLAAVLPLLKDRKSLAEDRFVIKLLCENNLLFPLLSDPGEFPLDEAIEVARRGMREDSSTITRLSQFLQSGDLSDEAQQRLLDILVSVAPAERLPMILSHMTRHRNPNVRSRATLLAGKLHHDAKWLRRQLMEPDHRVRANSLEALWGIDEPECRDLFQRASADPNPRVRANAAVALYLAGDPSSIEKLLRMASAGAPAARLSAAWAMGRLKDPRFLHKLDLLARDLDERIASSAAAARAAIQQWLSGLADVPAIDLRLLGVQVLPNGTRRISIVARDPATSALLPLLSTQFLLFEDDEPLFEYWLEPPPANEPFSVGFVMDSDSLHGLSGLIEHSTETGGSADTWVVTRFDAASRAAEPGTPGLSQIANDGRPISAALFAMKLLAGSRSARRVLIIVCRPADPALDRFDIERITGSALAADVTVHVVAPEILRNLFLDPVRRTSGTFVRVRAEDHLPSLLIQLYGALHAQYQLCYRAPGAGARHDAQVRVEVLSPAGKGFASIRLR